jgi:hypothetical protein
VALYIYRWGGLAPQGNPFTSLNLLGLLFSVRIGGTGQTGALDVQILYKSYLPHPDSDLDVPHMNLYILDEAYPMVKPNCISWSLTTPV